MGFNWSPFRFNRWGVPPIPNPVTRQGQATGATGGPPPPEWQALTRHADAVAAHIRTKGWSASLGFELAHFGGREPRVKILDALHAPGGASPSSPNSAALADAHRQVPSTRFELWVNGPASADPKRARGSRWTYVGALRLDQILAATPDGLAKIALESARKQPG